MTTSGQMRESVELLGRMMEEDPWGGDPRPGEFAVQATVPARIVGMKGTESVVASRLQGIQPFIITIRNAGAASAVDTTWQVRNARTSQTYSIKSIIIDERGVFADLLCETGTPE